MKKILFALTALGVILSLGVKASSDKPLRLGTEGAYPPFNFIDVDGKLKGLDIDIGEALCAEMKVKCQWVVQEWDGIIPALKAKKFDAILASMAITEKRAKEVDFTDRYYFTPGMMIARKGSNLRQDALAGKTVGVQIETNDAQWMEENYKNKGVTLKQYKVQDDANLDLMNGRLDIVVADRVVLEDWIKNNGGYDKFERVGDLITDPKRSQGTGIAVRKDSKALLESLNKAIAAIKANGTYHKITGKYFDFDIS